MNENVLSSIDLLSQKRIDEIRAAQDLLTSSQKIYYVSADGDDANDGLSADRPWKTLQKVSSFDLGEGECVLFRRGDVFRGSVNTRQGVSYGAYGSGDKPRFYGWDYNLADPTLWEEVNPQKHIWKLRGKILDVGTLVFGDDELCSRKLIPSYINGKFVCRNDESKPFDMAKEMTEDLDLYWHYDERTTTTPSKGQSFPIPIVDENSLGELYLRCDRGNPALVYHSIEALTKRSMFKIGSNKNVRIDNLCIKYVGLHAICGGGHVVGLHVTNCEIGWIGGTIQHYSGNDPNYPEGNRGSVTRFGNAVEIYGGCEDYLVQGCYIYQIYDAGVTHQITTKGNKYILRDIRYIDNLIDRCVYAIEYFLDMTEGDTESLMSRILIKGNILRRSGYGWGQQRHNVSTPALIKGWSFVNNAEDFCVTENIFDRSAYRLLHLVAQKQKSCPEMDANTYVQYSGGMLGQYGANASGEPPILTFDEQTYELINEKLGDKKAKIYLV